MKYLKAFWDFINQDTFVNGNTDTPLWFKYFVIPAIFAFPIVLFGHGFVDDFGQFVLITYGVCFIVSPFTC